MMYGGLFNVGYAGAGGSLNSQALAGFNSWSSTATIDLCTRFALISRARQLYISSPLASAVVDRMTSGVIGAGLKYQPPETSEYIGDGYKELSESIKKKLYIASHLHKLDVQRKLDFAQLQELACRNWLLSGDVFFVRTLKDGGYSWRCIEADRVQSPYYYMMTPNFFEVVKNPETGNCIIDGVEIDNDGCSVAYWILKDYIEKPLFVTQNDIVRIPAFDEMGMPIVLHLYKQIRPDQYRGVPVLASIIEALHSIKNYTQSELQAAALQASVFGFIQTDNPTMDEFMPLTDEELDRKIYTSEDDNGNNNNQNTVNQNTVNQNAANSDTMQLSTEPPPSVNEQILYNQIYPKPKTVSAGQIVHLSDNEKIQFLQSTHPNQNYGAFIKAIHTDIAASVGVPEKALDCTYDGTYSSSRAAVLESNRLYKNLRSYFISSFVRPVFESFVYGVLKDNVQDAEYISSVMGIESIWQAPTALCLDPKVELEGWKLAIDMGLVTSDEAAMALYGHKAVSTPKDGVLIEKDYA